MSNKRLIYLSNHFACASACAYLPKRLLWFTRNLRRSGQQKPFVCLRHLMRVKCAAISQVDRTQLRNMCAKVLDVAQNGCVLFYLRNGGLPFGFPLKQQNGYSQKRHTHMSGVPLREIINLLGLGAFAYPNRRAMNSSGAHFL